MNQPARRESGDYGIVRAEPGNDVEGDPAEQRRIVRVLERLERNDTVALGTLPLFIRSWLTANSATTYQSSAAARANGTNRYDRFVEALGRCLSSGSSFSCEIAQDNPLVGTPFDGSRTNS